MGNKKTENNNYISRPQQFLTVEQVASALQVSRDYVRRLIDRRLITAVKMPGGRNSPIRIPLSSVEKLLSDYAIREKTPMKNLSQKSKRRIVYRGVFSV